MRAVCFTTETLPIILPIWGHLLNSVISIQASIIFTQSWLFIQKIALSSHILVSQSITKIKIGMQTLELALRDKKKSFHQQQVVWVSWGPGGWSYLIVKTICFLQGQFLDPDTLAVSILHCSVWRVILTPKGEFIVYDWGWRNWPGQPHTPLPR